MGKSGALIQDLILDLPVNFHEVKELKIEQSLNNHATAYVTGVLKEENHEAINCLTSQTNVTIKIKKECEEKVIFCGIPVSVTINHGHDGYSMKLLLKSSSFRMDILRKSRSFQNPDNFYQDLFHNILREYGGDVFDAASRGTVQKEPLIQYEETDWEFLRRTASRVGAGIFPDVCSDRPRIYIGIPEGNSYNVTDQDYSLEKNIGDYLYVQKKDGSRIEKEALSCCLKSRNDYQLGDKISCRGTVFVVSEKIMEMQEGLLVYQYRLRLSGDLKQMIQYHSGLRGLSIGGQVLDIKEDKVKVHLSIDQDQDPDEAAWYPFHTAYAAEGATGWYSMPQTGDNIQLYLPDADEKKAYVRSVSRQDGATNPKVQNPAVKYYGTVHEKEIMLSPEEIMLSAVEDILYLKMSQDSGVEINSHKDINIKTQKQLTGECRDMEIKSSEKIVLATHSTSIVVDDIVHIKG
ncbi:phage protein D [Clostridium sp. ASBs410]|jgi:hypothetical protein|nr:phage protein D [Clostridium sp. ASBs410]